MDSIYASVGSVLLVSVGVYAATRRAALKLPARTRCALVAAMVAGIVAYVVFLHDRLALARLVPLPDAIVLGNPVPMAVAAVVALVAKASGPVRLRRMLLLGVLVLAVGRLLYVPLAGAPPACGDLWEDGVCRQTTEFTCGAAAAATLLGHHGIEAAEGEMADLCLSRTGGTPRLGLYRGMKRKTEGTPWRVEVFSGDVAKLRERAGGPVIIFVGLKRGQEADPRYARDWGWTPGVRHAVVLFGFEPEGMIDIGDPSMGREMWREEALDVLWDGWGMTAVKRER